MQRTGRAEWSVGAWLVALGLAYELPYAIAFSGGTYHSRWSRCSFLWPPSRREWRDRGNTSGRVAEPGSLFAFAVIEAQYGYYAVTMSG